MLRPDLNRKREEKMRHHPYGRADNAPPRRGGGERDGRRMNSSNDQYPRQGGGGDRMYGGRMSGEPMPQYGGPPPMGMDPSGMMSMPPSGAYPQSMQPGMNMMQPYMGMPQMMPYYDLNQMNMSASAGQGMYPMMPPQGQMPPGMMQQQMPGHYSQPPPPQMPPQHRYEDQQRMSGPYGGADNRSNAGSDYRQPSGGGGRQTSGGGRKDDGMPAPIHKEFPCRVLFVRNVCYDCPESEIKNMFAAFGEVKKFYSILETRGMAFITYFDLRDAERAKNELQGSEVRGRRIDVHYSLPKDEELETKVCDREKNQGTCIMHLRDTEHQLSTDEVRDLFSGFGEIKSLRINRKSSSNQAFLEYYDSRALVAAVEEMDGKKLFGGSLQVKYAWDQPLQAREQIPRKRESRDERSAAPPSKSSSQRDGRDHRDGRDGRDSRDNRDNRPPPMPTPAPPAPQSLNAQAQQAQKQMQMAAAAAKPATTAAVPTSTATAGNGELTAMLTNSLSAITSGLSGGASVQDPNVVAQMSQLLNLLQQKQQPVSEQQPQPQQQQQTVSRDPRAAKRSSVSASGTGESASSAESGAAAAEVLSKPQQKRKEIDSQSPKQDLEHSAKRIRTPSPQRAVASAENVVSQQQQQQPKVSATATTTAPTATTTTTTTTSSSGTTGGSVSSLEQMRRLASLLLQPSSTAAPVESSKDNSLTLATAAASSPEKKIDKVSESPANKRSNTIASNGDAQNDSQSGNAEDEEGDEYGNQSVEEGNQDELTLA